MREQVTRGLTLRLFSEFMRLLITLTPQWEVSREKEMTQLLLFYSQRMRGRREAKVFQMQS